MKLKTLFKSIMAVVTVAMLNLALTSCRGSEPEPESKSTPSSTPSLVGTWTFLLGDEGYFMCTFTGDGTSGTFIYEENEKGNIERESMNYTYTGGYIIFYEGNFSKTVKVISLTSTTLVLQDFPDNGICTLTKSGDTPVSPTPSISSIVGTWKYSWGNGNFYLLTFYPYGSVQVYTCWEGTTNISVYFYTYSGRELHLSHRDPPSSYKDIDVVRLTSEVLVLRDFPFEEECTYIRQL